MLGLLPLELNTGPWTRKSSSLCSLLLLLTIATLAVPGQVNSEEVGLGKHTKNGENVMLTANTVTSDRAGIDLASHNFKELYPDACDVTIKDGYIELRYKKGSKGCTVDLLSTDSSNNNKIKFKAGVRGNADGKLNDCLDAGASLEQSYSNLLPFVYSVDNKGIEDLNNRQYNDSGAECKRGACKDIDGKCKRHTSLQVSWSQSDGEVYAHTYLIGENNKGLSQSKKPEGESMTLDLVISTASGFTMEYAKDEGFDASTKAACVHRSTPLFEPKTWKITNDGEFKDKHLLVFSLLRQNASYTYKDSKLAVPPNGPECELFIQFVSFAILRPFCNPIIFVTLQVILFFLGCKLLQDAHRHSSNDNATDHFNDH
ncbi:unnamed protein product [Meloidogyne enterolobii]|uniref:Uncharacterized protein n=1 Tax=Meloidogyne enterolobii TaxID=390850 RepID=A0ACB0Y4P8_MELEN